MSKVAIKGNASGTGTFTLEAPNSNTDRTLVLPDEAGTVLTSASTINGLGSLTGADTWRLTADLTSNGDITSNLERADDASSGLIGTGMTESSGVFTFPSTGIWQVAVMISYTSVSGNIDSIFVDTSVSSDSGSSYDFVTTTCAGIEASGAQAVGSAGFALVDVTNATTFRVKFTLSSLTVGSLIGQTGYNRTAFSFIRLGDT